MTTQIVTMETTLPCGKQVKYFEESCAIVTCYNCNSVRFVNQRTCAYTCGKSTDCPIAGLPNTFGCEEPCPECKLWTSYECAHCTAEEMKNSSHACKCAYTNEIRICGNCQTRESE